MSHTAFAHPAPPDPPELPAGVPARPPWLLWMPFAALATAIIGAGLFAAVAIAIAGAVGQSTTDPPAGFNLLANLFGDASFVAAALLFARMTSRPTPAQFGLRRPLSLRRAAGWTAAGYLLFIAFSAGWLALIGSDAKDDIAEELGVGRSDVLALAALAAFATVVAPIAEEFFFRGFCFTALRNRLGVWGGALITGLLFGGVHVAGSPVAFLVPLALFGFVLCLIYWRTHSLYPCMALHCLNNSIAFGTILGWDWQIPLLVVGSLLAVAAVMALVGRLVRPAGLALPVS